jgi:hypothetical protein
MFIGDYPLTPAAARLATGGAHSPDHPSYADRTTSGRPKTCD